jgi:4-aminobutyrate aminotransferase-like enzyme/Ser/Thr protein kinase RdoA (MazF antagonist)
MTSSDKDTGIKFMDRNPPAFSEDFARRVAEQEYALQGEFTALISERDQNFKVRENGSAWVLKISNADEAEEVIDFQIRALEHLERQDPGLPVPRVRRNADGEAIRWVEGPDGARHMVRAVSFLPGTMLDDAGLSPDLLHDVGVSAARLDRALRGFFHPAAANPHPWDLSRAANLRPHTRHIADKASRQAAEQTLDHFGSEVAPRLAGLRHQVIHADAGGANLVVDSEANRVSGIIDFGDMMFAPLVTELALLLDFLRPAVDDRVALMEAGVAGYDSGLALEEDEVDLVYDLVLARYVQTMAIIAWRRAETPDQPDYLHELEPVCGEAIDQLMSIGRDAVRARLRRAICYPPYCAMGDADTPETDDAGALLARRHNSLGEHLLLTYDNPVHVERGRGPWLYDANGRAMLDGYNNVPTVGHSHPHVARAVGRQIAALATNTRYLYRVIVDYAEQLADTFPGDLGACIFVNSGSEANDVAWQISRFLTGKRGGIIMEDAYHGITEALTAFSPHHGDALQPHMRALLPPDPYRGPYGAGEPDLAAKYAADADRAIAELDEAGYGTACVMIDTSFCSNGVPDVPEDYLRLATDKVRAAGGLFIADEVQYGFGRPGTHMWGFESYGARPDIVTLGKPVGNGIPLGVVVTTPEILDAFGKARGLFSTFGGNPVACAAGSAVLDVIASEGLVERAGKTGEYLREGLRGLMNKHPLIGDVRGRGLIAGVEIVKDRESREPARAEMERILNRMRELGVLTGQEGHHGNIFKIRPNLSFQPEHADILVGVMDQALSEM